MERVKTYRDVELWFDPDVIDITITGVTTKNGFQVKINTTPNYEINGNDYAIRFKRDTRNDFVLTHDNYHNMSASLPSLVKLNDQNNIIQTGIVIGTDPDTTRMEIIVETGLIQTNYDVKMPDHQDVEFTYQQALKDDLIDVNINGQDYRDGVHYDDKPYIIEIVNKRIGLGFDIDNIEFNTPPKFDPSTGEFKSIEYNVIEKTLNKLVYEVNDDNFKDHIRLNQEERSLYLNFLPFLKWVGIETPPTVDPPDGDQEDYPFLNRYIIDDDNLIKLNSELLTFNTENSLYGYVSNIIRLPYHVQASKQASSIIVGDHSFTALGKPIDYGVITINLGSIDVNHDILKGVSYKNIDFTLNIPNFKPISLNVEKAINKTLDLKLLVDITTGLATLNVLDGNTTLVVERERIGSEIPFKSDNLNIRLNDDIYNTHYKKPTIDISVLEPDNNVYSERLKQRNVTNGSVKLIKSDKILLNTTATYQEQLEIENLLRKGVFIHE